MGGHFGSLMRMLNHVFVNLDSTTNILFVSYMLEYNKSHFKLFLIKYNAFIRKLKCLNCLLFNYDYNHNNHTNHANISGINNKNVTTSPLNGAMHQKDNHNRDMTLASTVTKHIDSIIAVQDPAHSPKSEEESYDFSNVV